MAKKFQLSIPEPCHENWDEMTPVDKGRFCASCQKEVVDFSLMSDREIAQFFKKPSKGSLCGRFMQDQLHRDIAIPRKRIPWVKYFFQFALPAFLASAKVAAQGKVRIESKETVVVKENAVVGDTVLLSPVLKKNPAVCLPPSVGEVDAVISPDKTKRSFNDTLVLPEVTVVSMGVTKGKITRGTVFTKPPNDEIGSLVGIAGGVSIVHTVAKEDSLLKKAINFFLPPKFKTYPNPVKSGATLNIEWTQTETGDYYMQIINQAGALVYSRQLWIDAEARVLNIQVPSVSAGVYFLRMLHKGSGKSFTEKIIIQ